jgi:hypothetical protein
LIIPALQAVYTVPLTGQMGRGDIFDQMMHMFHDQGQRHTIYSNAEQVVVKDLPAHDPQVSAVGNFLSFHAKTNMQQANTGEGIVLTLELIGSGNIEQIKHPEIILPAGLKSYESNTKQQLLDPKTMLYKKDFEYIVQAVEPGAFTIDPQQFTFFDLQKKQYKTVESKSVELVITGEKKQSVVSNDSNTTEEQKINTDTIDNTFTQPIEQKEQWRTLSNERKIAWHWFFILVLFPLGFILVKALLYGWKHYRKKHALHYDYKRAFVIARKKFTQYKEVNDQHKLYNLFVQLCAARCSVPATEVTELFVEQRLRTIGMTEEQIVHWKDSFAQLTELSFMHSEQVGINTKIWSQAQYWIALLERML